MLKQIWETNKPLTAVGLGMLVVLGASLIGMAMDPRVITGAPAWLKPAKFAISTAIYALTLAWIFTYLPDWQKVKRVVGWITAVVFVLEVAIIDVQAARGTTSHFNVGTALDATLFAVMGSAIVIAWASSIAVVVALFRQHFEDRGWGWALRLGVLLTVFGAASGGLMTSPTKAQLAEARETHNLTVAGAHTVGGKDGGPGMPGTGWSREHGDLRVPHFIGLHGMQAIPLLALMMGRRRTPSLVITVSVIYGFVYALLMWQALAGRPFLGGLI